MSQFIQLLKNIAPGSPANMKREGRFKKFNKTPTKSTSFIINSGSSTNLSRRRSASTSALNQLQEDSIEEVFEDMKSGQKRNSSSSVTTIDNTNVTNESDIKSPLTVKELIEKMITHLQLLERKNEILTQALQQLSQEKSSIETNLSSAEVELNLYKNRLKQLEQTANEWHCSICMDNKQTITDSKRQIVATFCGHVLCSVCAQSSFSTSRQSKHCPTCRKPLKDGQLNYHPIFI